MELLSIRLRYFNCTWYTGVEILLKITLNCTLYFFRVEILRFQCFPPGEQEISPPSHPASPVPTQLVCFAFALLSIFYFPPCSFFLPFLCSLFSFLLSLHHNFFVFLCIPSFLYAAWQFSKVTRLVEIKHPNLPWLVTTNSSPAKLTPTHQQKCTILKCRKSTVCIFQCELCNVHCGIWNRLYAMYIVKCELSNVNPNSQAHFLHCAMRVVKLNVCVSRCAHCAFHKPAACKQTCTNQFEPSKGQCSQPKTLHIGSSFGSKE